MDTKPIGDTVPKRILNNLLSSLEAGVVPRSGAPYIAIGRTEEIASLLDNLDSVAEGSAATRLIIGRYGSGKSFLMQLVRGYALDRDFLTADADLSPERKLAGVGGIATYRELMRNFASKFSPDGGALPSVLARFYDKTKEKLLLAGEDPDSTTFPSLLRAEILHIVSDLESGVGGFEFARVLGTYFTALAQDDPEHKSACLRWLRGEFRTKTEAKAALGIAVGEIIDDTNWYDYLKLWAALSVRLGYRGLIVYIDECINLYKITNRISRESNYEKLLSIFNDTLEGRAAHLAVIFGGTPQFLEDTRRGLFSYDALRSRLADGRFAGAGYRNLSAPVIRLRRLTDNEMLALIFRLRKLYAQKWGSVSVTDEQCVAFLQYELTRAGADELITPREMIRDFLSLLNILKDNPAADFDALVRQTAVSRPSLSEDGTTSATAPAKQEGAGAVFDIEI